MKTLSWAGSAWLVTLAVATAPALAAESTASPHQNPKAFPYEYQAAALKNGLKIVMVPRPGSGLVAYYTLVRVGSRNEVEPGRSGYAHFFEHMMFRGTARYPAEKYQAVIQQYGANNNAFTDDDITVYQIFGRAEGLEKFIEIEADRFQSLDYSKVGFQTEAKAILGEYNKTRSNPGAKLYEELANNAFTKHTYKHTTIGFEADIKAMPQGFEYSRGFFKNYYTPDNTTIIVVGDFDPAQARKMIETAYGGWKGRAVLPKITKEPPQTAERRVDLPWPRPAKPMFLMGWHVPEASPRTIRESVVGTILPGLIFGSTSPLYRELVLEKQLADEFGAWMQEHRDPGLFILDVAAREPAHVPEIQEAIDRTLKQVAKEGVEPDRLEAVKSHDRYALLSSLEKDNRIADIIATTMSVTGDLEWLNQQYAVLATITNEDVKSFVGKYLVDSNRTVVTLRPTAAQPEPAAEKGGQP